MEKKEIDALAKDLAAQFSAGFPQVVGGLQFPGLSVASSSGCCEGRCPCNAKGGGSCDCNDKCSCHGKTAYLPDQIGTLIQLSQMDMADVKKVLEVGPLLNKLRGTEVNLD